MSTVLLITRNVKSNTEAKVTLKDGHSHIN